MEKHKKHFAIFLARRNKKGDFDWRLVIGIVVITIVGFVAWKIAHGGINKAYGSTSNFLKKAIGMEDEKDKEKQKEAERVELDLLANAINVYDNFNSMVQRCINKNSEDIKCRCDTIDSTKLNKYIIKVTNRDGTQFLELLDQDRVPVKEKINRLGNFLFGTISVGSLTYPENIDFYAGALSQRRYTLFFNNKIIFNREGNENALYQYNMEKITFVKPIKNVVIADEFASDRLRKCGS